MGRLGVDPPVTGVTGGNGKGHYVTHNYYWEMPGITARICGICQVNQLMASAKAGDVILGTGRG